MATFQTFGGGQLIAVPINGHYTVGRLTEVVEHTEQPDGSLDKRAQIVIALFDGTTPALTEYHLRNSIMLQSQLTLPKELERIWADVTPAAAGSVIALREKDRNGVAIYELARIASVEQQRTKTGTIATVYAVEVADGSYTMRDRPQAFMANAKVVPMHLSPAEAMYLKEAHWHRGMAYGDGHRQAGELEEAEEEAHQFSR